MSSKDKKLVQERVVIVAYGDKQIEEAKGKFPSTTEPSNDCLYSNRCHCANAKGDRGEDSTDQI